VNIGVISRSSHILLMEDNSVDVHMTTKAFEEDKV